MSLQPGSRLGRYEIAAPLGAGGMGEVYRGRDTSLDRAVAIKVLPMSTAGLPDARERLSREARALSRLSHPHICAVHDVGDDAGSLFVVMELLEGETLAARLGRGALGLAETRRVGGEIAEALGAAHRQGIVHRDLKPANVMLTSAGVKLLDFGLAKAIAPTNAESAATVGRSLTMEGTVVGTLQYMSPEQLEGRPADARSDIFALGVVLYEMVAGRRAFAGDTATAIAAAILTADPPPIAGAPALDRIVRGCLAKDPDRRWQSAQDVGLQLATIGDTSSIAREPARVRTRAWVPWALAGLALAVAIAAVWTRMSGQIGSAPVAAHAVAFTVAPPTGLMFATSVERVPFAVSPDGTMLAFIAGSAERGTSLWLRPLASVDAKPLAGTEGAHSPFWSPDSRAIGFFAGGKLRKIPIAGGAPVTICDVKEGVGITGTWGADGQILFASVQGEGILRVSTAGGTPAIEVAPDGTRNETRLLWPAFLPDGRRYLYTAAARDDKTEVRLGEPGRPFRTVLGARSNAFYVEPGYLLYVDDSSLLARRFDPATATVSGDPIPVAAEVTYFRATAAAMFTASPSGVVVYTDGVDRSRVAWFDRGGREAAKLRPPDAYLNLRISRDGREVLFDRLTRRTRDYDLWSLDVSNGVETRLTSSLETEVAPQFGPPGTVIYSASRSAAPRLTRRVLMTPGADERLLPDAAMMQIPADVSADGTWLLYGERADRGTYDIHALPLKGGSPVPIATTPFNEIHGALSPDARFVAFASDDTGRLEVYVAPFDAPGSKRRVSIAGGMLPRWDRASRALIYVAPDKRVMSVPFGAGTAPEFGTPAPLFTLPTDVTWSTYDIAPDGRFLAIVPVEFASRQPLTVLVNWSATLPR